MAQDGVAAFATEETASGGRLAFSGNWTVHHAGEHDDALRAVAEHPPRRGGEIVFDLGQVTAMDTAGAWLVYRTARDLQAAGAKIALSGGTDGYTDLIRLAEENDKPCETVPDNDWLPIEVAERMGKGVVAFGAEIVEILNMIGIVIVVLSQTLVRPQALRITSVVSHMERVGFNAVPIVALLTFLIGAVLAQQGATQLKMFGAEVFTVNLVGISVLREIAVLITAIIVAGRSGSAFTAEIGSMKVREEVDAMRTLGLDPVEVLVAPRVIALVLMLPVLTFIADLMGLLGGGVVAALMLEMSPQTYLMRVDASVDQSALFVGLIKAPFMAITIAVIGCLEGLRVGGSAESVGERTTSSVVKSIFSVIVLDALFAMFFTAVDY